MIVKMSKIRILGPRERLPEVLQVLQDTGVLGAIRRALDEREREEHTRLIWLIRRPRDS